MSLRLQSLELTNYKQFSDAKIEFDPGVTVVVGQNGEGKSNLLRSIV